ncbi:Rpn family recombination-promoting nuclease/putative transposase [Klebsiella variicola]|uniref:Rpn family recombination-promoting nuclease/putative transposase n=1 Tax=Klebsiella variicola TaxID=244366 RepID=UPI0009BAAF0E|nr:Rpn family recombination-promoting nuclease/putative transposase [Klebsiella variicola]EIW9274961.1 Rpn family recombination-promoting nuclease/putative transposase [Klebsiella variicola]ELC9130762.1 Rpn family recombination-promoting nuclease/putative transposase [Klebsiella variicola]MBG2047224.1 Rpn family recombination-promoting nuclease/putative transposase [Klebsiella variicola]MBZ6721188.1 Rpn family recombination-promoting nuclease/putative transposase [Klebsiella variicola]UVW55731
MKKKPGTPTPHDATFRQFLANPDVARDFMQLHLPAELQALCDLNTLKLESGTFVEDDLRQYASDILWSMKTTTGDDGYIHLLLEHQSSADKNMAFRQLRYAVAAMQRHLEAGHKKLPLVIPVLFYHGSRSPYPFSTNWLDCFSNPEQAGRVYTNDFPLVDVTVINDDEIMNHRRMAALTLLMKHIRQRDMMELLDRLPRVMVEWISPEQVRVLINYNYIVNAGEAPAPEFMRALAERLPQHEDELMTIAQQLEQIGVEKGIKLGRQEGRTEGERDGERKATLKIARTMLQNGIDRNTVMKMTGLTEDDLAQIRH